MGGKIGKKSRPGQEQMREQLVAELRRRLGQYRRKSLGTLTFCWNGYFAGFGLFALPPKNAAYSPLDQTKINMRLEYPWLDSVKQADREWLMDEAYKAFVAVREQGGFADLQIHDKFRFLMWVGGDEMFSSERRIPWAAPDPGIAARNKRRGHPPTIERTWQRIAAWVREHGGERALVGLSPPVRDRDLKRAEKKLGRPLRAQLPALWRTHDGGLNFDHWRLHTLDEALLCYQQNVAIARDVAARDAREAAEDDDLDCHAEDDDFFDPDWFPICSDGAGNSICVHLASGSVIEVCHDPYYRKEVAPSLRRWLAARLAEIEAGAYEVDALLGS